jgi:Flp pilus assembly pilin Flp
MKAMAGIIRFLQSESAATAVEYGLLLAFISLAIIATVAGFGMSVKENLYEKVLNEISS